MVDPLVQAASLDGDDDTHPKCVSQPLHPLTKGCQSPHTGNKSGMGFLAYMKSVEIAFETSFIRIDFGDNTSKPITCWSNRQWSRSLRFSVHSPIC